jgi:hypothetical protein
VADFDKAGDITSPQSVSPVPSDRDSDTAFSPASGSSLSDEFAWDVFISFRHKDARNAARELRLQLQKWRLADDVLALRTGRLRVYLDTFQGRVTEDYWTENIARALRSSRYLLVIVSPGVFELADDGNENWVQKEIGAFLETRQRANIIPVYARSQKEKTLPVAISSAFPRIQTFDLGSTDSFMPHLPLLESPARLEFVRIVAAIRGVQNSDYPKLFREEWRRRVRSFAIAGLVGFAVLCAVAIAGAAALVNGIEAVRASAKTSLRLAVEAAVQRPDEAVLHAVRALKIVDSSVLYRFFLNSERARARGIVGSLTLPSSNIVWPGGRVAGIVLSPDKSEFAVWTENSRLVVYDARTLTLKSDVGIPGLHSLCNLGYSQGSWLLLCGGSPPQIRLIGRDGAVRNGPVVADADDAILLEDGNLLHRSGATGRLALVNPVTGMSSPLGELAVGRLEAAAVVPRANRLIVHTRVEGGGGYEQRLLDLESGKQIGSAGMTSQIDPRPTAIPGAGIYLRHRGAYIEKFELSTAKSVGLIGIEGHAAITAYTSENGRLAVVQRDAPGGSVEIWDLVEARQIAPPLHPIVLFAPPVFSASGTKVAIKTPTGALLLDMQQPDAPLWLAADGPVNEIAFLADDKVLAVADLTGRVTIFDANGQPTVRGVRHRDGGVQLAVLPDGRILSGGWDGSIRATSLEIRQSSISIPAEGSGQMNAISTIAPAPEGEDFVYANSSEVGRCTAGTTICKWRLPLKEAPASVDFVGNGKSILLGFKEKGASLRDSDTGREVFAHGSALLVSSTTQSSLAIIEDGAAIGVRTTGRLGRQICKGSEPIVRPLLAKMTRGGERVVIVSQDAKNNLLLSSYDARYCRRQWVSQVGVTAVGVISISERFGYVAIGGAGGGELFHLEDGIRWDKSLEDRNMLFAIIFSPADPVLLTLGASRKISAYDLRDGGRRFTPFEARLVPWQAQFLPMAHRFAVAYITANEQQQFLAQMYDAELGLPLGPPLLHPSDVLSIETTSTGRYLLTGCSDGVVRAWGAEPDPRSLDEILTDAVARTGETIDMDAGAIRAARGPSDRVTFGN